MLAVDASQPQGIVLYDFKLRYDVASLSDGDAGVVSALNAYLSFVMGELGFWTSEGLRFGQNIVSCAQNQG